MNRDKPVYRCFDLTDQGGRDGVWYTVEVDNSPGAEVSSFGQVFLTNWVQSQPWCQKFWEAYAKNKKATIYRDA